MKRALGRPAPLPYVDEDDLLSLAADLGAGYFAASEIYSWHVGHLAEVGREPVGVKKFGMALREAGWPSSSRNIEGRMTRCWMISKPWSRRGQEWLAQQRTDREVSTGQPG